MHKSISTRELLLDICASGPNVLIWPCFFFLFCLAFFVVSLVRVLFVALWCLCYPSFLSRSLILTITLARLPALPSLCFRSHVWNFSSYYLPTFTLRRFQWFFISSWIVRFVGSTSISYVIIKRTRTTKKTSEPSSINHVHRFELFFSNTFSVT
jgi:hypothetical protein